MPPVTEPQASWPIIAQEFEHKIMQPLLRFFFLQYDISCCLPLLNKTFLIKSNIIRSKNVRCNILNQVLTVLFFITDVKYTSLVENVYPLIQTFIRNKNCHYAPGVLAVIGTIHILRYQFGLGWVRRLKFLFTFINVNSRGRGRQNCLKLCSF